MHIPDNYLSPSTCVVAGVIMLPIWAVAINRIKANLSIGKMPLLGISAAFCFLIMMFNIPLPGGTTGHAVGAALIAILIGPFAACLSVTAALLIQALFFGDGGLLAFGANAFNMAFVMPFAGYYIYKLLKAVLNSSKGDFISVFIASYVSLNLAAFFTAVEFGIQPIFFKDLSGLPIYAPYPLGISIPAMMIPHLLIAGFVEAMVSLGVYSYIKKVSPELIYGDKNIKLKPAYAMLLFMVILSPIGLFASGTAWGEWGNEEIKKLLGYIPIGMKKGFNFSSILPEYTVSTLNNGVMAYIISAIIGTAVILIGFKFLVNVNKK